MTKVKADDLANTIVRNLTSWSEEIVEGITKDTDEISKEAKKQLEHKAPKRTGRYARGFAVKKTKTGKRVYNKDRYQLTHLLEHGHLTKGGRRTRPQKHFAPVEEWAVDELVERTEKRINGS